MTMPNCVPVPYACKICKRPIELQIDRGCAEEWLLRLLPSATCDTCYGLYRSMRKAKETIRRSCVALNTTDILEEDRSEVAKRVRGLLIHSTKAYAASLAGFHKADLPYWDESLLDSLMQHPGDWHTVLRDFRRSTARWHRTPTVNPEDSSPAGLPYKD